jgi:hypothetical protein
MLADGNEGLGVAGPAADKSWFWSGCADGIRVESRCVEDADDSAALSGLVGFFAAAIQRILERGL